MVSKFGEIDKSLRYAISLFSEQQLSKLDSFCPGSLPNMKRRLEFVFVCSHSYNRLTNIFTNILTNILPDILPNMPPNNLPNIPTNILHNILPKSSP